MNVKMKSAMKCTKFQSNKKLHSSIEEDAENVTKTANARINNKNESSPKSCREHITPNNHSTPVRQKLNSNKVEESPDLDYSPSPILLPCTQDGGNEVAWDWQNTLNKTPNSRKKQKQNVQSETPKRTKLFPRKRNSDSPLLCKPLKRKTINMEDKEHIGQFAAELLALSEKMKIIKQNDQNESDDCIKEVPAVVNTSNEEEVKPTIRDNKENCGTETNSHNNVSKKSSSYDDLFDDSVDDSMARCTQEMEEKLNLIAGKGSSAVHPQVDIKEEKLSPTSDTVVKIEFEESTVAVQPKASSTKSLFHGSTTSSSTLRTYSKLSSRKDANSSTMVSPWKDKDLHKLCLNNNMLHCDIEKSYDDKKLSKDSAAELFGIPDDSFDDCLATCIEDDKLFSTPAESSSFIAPKIEPSYKTLTHAPLKGKQYSYNNTISEARSTVKVETSTVSSLNNRKFFKSKSLSDKCIGQNAIANCKSTAYVTFPSYSAKSASHLSSSSKSSVMSYGRSVGLSSVSRNLIATNDRRQIEDSAISLMSSADRTLGSDVNRSAVKEGGNRFVKHNSTGNMRNDTREPTKISSQPARCTAEEIERKRLQAKAKREARQKQYVLNIQNNKIASKVNM